MNKKIGFIGCGNMGKAMVMGLINSGKVDKAQLIASEKFEQAKENIEKEIGIVCTSDNREVAQVSDIIFLAVKPNMYKTVIEEITDLITEDKVIVTIAAGVTLQGVEEWFGKKVKIVKTMPNTPALVGEGMSAICHNELVTKEELEEVCSLYEGFGKYELLEEKYFHGFVALCGSSPAYVFMFIEAMADAGVKFGIPRASAYKMAEQSILGSAKLALETGKHPAELKDMVCSPGGTTIDAVTELENQGFRNSVIKAMEKCVDKSKSM